MPPENNRFLSWKWLVGLLLVVVFSASGVILSDTRVTLTEAKQNISLLQKEKLDKDQYIRDITEIKGTLLRMDAKLDRIDRARR